MTSIRPTLLCAASLILVATGAASAQQADPQAIVDALFKAGGNQPNVRGSGAKGVCVTGGFTPSAEAPGLSKAPHFTKPLPVTARFSMGGSNPKVSDKAKPVTRGFSMRIADPAGDMVFVFISAPVFGTKTPEQLLAFATVRAPGPDGKPDADKIKAFSAANPETTRQAAWLNARPIPASYAGVDYWGVHAYTLTDAKGTATVAKLKTVAVAGQLGLGDDEAKAKPDAFYADELKERLAQGPARFDLVAILGEAGDPTNDPTAPWPEESRKSVKLGTLAITALEPAATCDAATFDPVVDLPEGVAGPADDPMFAIRSPAYAISLSRRAN
ncbi:catalase family peroxidase [Methylobacterium sp. J-068]|uniref:catalase family peroxidase n=1 Tax=Methylobacterium sp. J-068 TaxID=2836649 RepID=UPI001FB97071|nr:catalase family peroxidase [Methylobacterium sp. J-068]MCJ2032943.1 catalase family peroxidase [Methylobacterium sp. J-068]